MKEVIGIIVSVVVVIVFFVGGAIARRCEANSWNGGRCPRCGRLWHCFDMDSQGGRGYNCTKCGIRRSSIWISYKVDKYPVNFLTGWHRVK